MKIVLYGMGRPTRATRAAWALEEAGADWSAEAVDPRSAEYRALNPMGTVPAIVVDGVLLTESAAICTWVGEHFPEAGLVPAPRTPERAQYDRWSSFVVTELEQPCWLKAKHTFVLPEHLRVPQVKNAAQWEFTRAAGVLSEALGDRPFLVGDQFTCADILAAHTCFWAQRAGFDLPTGLATYAGRHAQRPAFQRAMSRPH
ncbi:MAG: glutathione S-transferase family protein [Myxococcota bacterium]